MAEPTICGDNSDGGWRRKLTVHVREFISSNQSFSIRREKFLPRIERISFSMYPWQKMAEKSSK
jgi:hypothetical protein